MQIGRGLLYIRLVLMARSDELALMFGKPTLPVHRRFEVCRAYFKDSLTAAAIAERFGLHVGSVQVMVRDFAARSQSRSLLCLQSAGTQDLAQTRGHFPTRRSVAAGGQDVGTDPAVPPGGWI